MFPEKEILLLYAESSLHAGAGSDVGYVDNPIQRERATGFPIIQSNGVKGALREFFESAPGCDHEKVSIVFGPEEQTAAGAGAVSFGEARVLLFPVRSLAGVFGYATCPAVLSRFQRDLVACGKPPLGEKGNVWEPVAGIDRCLIHTDSLVKAGADGVVLEEMLFTANSSDAGNAMLEKFARHLCPQTPEYRPLRDSLPKRLVVLNNNDFSHFVDQATEVEPHNRIDDEKGTVDPNGVWYTEYLPSETILHVCLFVGRSRVGSSAAFNDAGDIRNYLVAGMENQRIWIGGDRSTGKGRLMAFFWNGAAPEGAKEGVK